MAVLVMAAVMIAGLVSLGIAGDYIYFGQMGQALGVHAILIVTPVAGIAGGLTGGLFSRTVLALAAPSRAWIKRLKAQPVLFAGGCGLAVAILGLAPLARLHEPPCRRRITQSHAASGRMH